MAESYIQGPYKKTGSSVSFYARLYYEKTAETPTYVTYTFRSGMYINSGQSPEFNGWGSLNYNGSTLTGTGGVKGYSGKYREFVSKHTQTWYKTATAQTKTVSFAARKNSDSSSYQSNGSLSITIPALQLPVISNFSATRDSEEYNKIKYSFDVSTPVSGSSDISWYIDGVENNGYSLVNGNSGEKIITLGGDAASIAGSHTLKIKAVDSSNASLVKESGVITIPEILAPTITKVTVARDTNNQNIVKVDYEIAKIKEDQVTVIIECDLNESWEKTKYYTSNITSKKIKDSVTFDKHGASASTITVTIKGLTDKGESKTYKVSPSFYTMDFGAKGKSIAMGKMAGDSLSPYIINHNLFKNWLANVKELSESEKYKIILILTSWCDIKIEYYTFSGDNYHYNTWYLITIPDEYDDAVMDNQMSLSEATEKWLNTLGLTTFESITLYYPFGDTVDISENGLFECNMDAKFYGALNFLPIGASYSVYDENTNPNDFLYGTWELREKLVSTTKAYSIISLNSSYVGSNSGGSPYTRQEWSVRKNILYLSAGYVCNSWGGGDEYHYAAIPIKITEFYRFWASGASTGGKVADSIGLEKHTDGNIAIIMKTNGGTAAWNAACMSVDLTHFTWSFDSSKNIDYYTEYVWVRTA